MAENGSSAAPSQSHSSPIARKPRKSRGRGLRTTTGCAVCRKRHLKCDETRPVCGPCAKGNRPCVYGNLPHESDVDTIITSASKDTASVATMAAITSSTASAPSAPHPPPVNVPASQAFSRPKRTSFSSNQDPKPSPTTTQWARTPTDDTYQITSPQSNYSNSTGYGTEVAPLRWFGLLAGDAAHTPLELPSPETLRDAAGSLGQEPHSNGMHAQDQQRAPVSIQNFAENVALPSPSKLLQLSAISPAPLDGSNSGTDERQFWQSPEPVLLKGHEYDIFQRFVTGVSLWIDLFDPMKYFSTLVPHLALHNEGLMKAVLALGARHLSIKPMNSGEVNVDRTAAVQYYYETLQYLQSAMRFTSYKNSLELLATVLVVSTYEMIDGSGKGWERHLKGVFWIQRSREINGESGGFEQAVWWAWLRQDVWAAFREHRRCFSFFKPTKPYHAMHMWDVASRVVYILAQSVNYSSEEEKQSGEADLPGRILRANNLLNMLEEWRTSGSVHFDPLPVEGPMNRAFRPIWIHPPALGVSLQMYCMARILLLAHQPSAGGYLEYLERNRIITDCIDTIGGIAMKLTDDAARLMSTQCLFAAGLYCHEEQAKRLCIAELIQDHQSHTGWPVNTDLSAELHAEWLKQSAG